MHFSGHISYRPWQTFSMSAMQDVCRPQNVKFCRNVSTPAAVELHIAYTHDRITYLSVGCCTRFSYCMFCMLPVARSGNIQHSLFCHLHTCIEWTRWSWSVITRNANSLPPSAIQLRFPDWLSARCWPALCRIHSCERTNFMHAYTVAITQSSSVLSIPSSLHPILNACLYHLSRQSNNRDHSMRQESLANAKWVRDSRVCIRRLVFDISPLFDAP